MLPFNQKFPRIHEARPEDSRKAPEQVCRAARWNWRARCCAAARSLFHFQRPIARFIARCDSCRRVVLWNPGNRGTQCLGVMRAAAHHHLSPASFRDPAGCVVYQDGVLKRLATAEGIEDYRRLMSSGLYELNRSFDEKGERWYAHTHVRQAARCH